MIDLSVLKDRWTQDGAREVFAQLVTHCVRSNHPGARAIRPDPGDDGVDTFFGEFDKDVRVWQAKYFCDGVGDSQRSQIRASWKACTSSSFGARVTLWTLCLPCDLSIDEEKWWQQWKAKEEKKAKIPIELWTKPNFASFSCRKDLEPLFSYALSRTGDFINAHQVIAAMNQVITRPVAKLPTSHGQFLQQAVFVRKLEAAGIKKHRAARAAFYNFELVRKSIEEGGTSDEAAALEDIQERTYALWESLFHAHCPERLGRALYVAVDNEISAQDTKQLDTSLHLHLIHKKGGLHHWADICEAGWTKDHASLIEAEETSEGTSLAEEGERA